MGGKYKPDEHINYDLAPELRGVEITDEMLLHKHMNVPEIGKLSAIEESITGLWENCGKTFAKHYKEKKPERNTPQKFVL